MTTKFTGIQTESLDADITGVAEAHGLTANERARLLRMVIGAIPGNRDRPVFLLARCVTQTGSQDPFDLIIPGQSELARLDAAFLDFLITVAVVDQCEFGELMRSFAAVIQQDEPARRLASVLSRVLHAYRTRVLPDARHHNVFTAIRRFYALHRPEDPVPRDGDALDFWEAEASRTFLTRYVTAIEGLVDYADAARLASSWKFEVALDSVEVPEIATDAGKDESADDPFASETLAASLDALSEAPIKLLLTREIEEIAALSSIAGAARRWPLSVLVGLGLGPVQNAITEGMRRQKITPDFAVQIARAEHYANLRDRYELLSEKLLDALHLAYIARLPENETVSARSNLSPERKKRIEAVQRRSSYANIGHSVRAQSLLALVEPLAALRALLEATCAQWRQIPAVRLNETEGQHRARFQSKLEALYGAEAEGEVR